MFARKDAVEAILFPGGKEDTETSRMRAKSAASTLKSLMDDLFRHPDKKADPNSVVEANVYQVTHVKD